MSAYPPSTRRKDAPYLIPAHSDVSGRMARSAARSAADVNGTVGRFANTTQSPMSGPGDAHVVDGKHLAQCANS